MARSIQRMRPLQVKQLKTPGMYPDGGGLYLQVNGEDAKSWVFRYAVEGRERYMGLGSASTITIDRAREEARKCREMRHDGIDPIEQRQGVQDAERATARQK